jgi:hypothetical protein
MQRRDGLTFAGINPAQFGKCVISYAASPACARSQFLVVDEHQRIPTAAHVKLDHVHTKLER